MTIENEDLETKYRLLALKKACIAMNALADSIKDETTKSETQPLAWTISWAVTEITKLQLISSELAVALARIAEGSVSDDKQNSAHGKTIAEAHEDLIYKAVAKFDGEIPTSATGKEWVGIYRSITGACAAGVKNFVEQTGKSLDDTYTAKEIAKLVKGHYGAEKFAERIAA